MGAWMEAAALTRRDAEAAIESTPLLEGLLGKHIFLTGGTGFAGSWLLELIAAMNDRASALHACRVTVLSRRADAAARQAPHLAAQRHFRFVSGDVRELEPGFLEDEAPFDAVIHAASPAGPVALAEDEEQVGDIIVEGTRRVLKWASAQGVSRLLMVSSGAADQHGVWQGRAVYANAKRAAEALCDGAGDGELRVSIARPYSFMGPYQSLESGFAVTDFIRDGLRGGPIRVRGGESVRSYAYGGELAVWLLVILLHGSAGARYAIGSGEPITVQMLGERVQAAFRRAGREVALEVAPAPIKGTRYVPDLTGMDALNLRQIWTLDESLERTIAWFRLREAV